MSHRNPNAPNPIPPLSPADLGAFAARIAAVPPSSRCEPGCRMWDVFDTIRGLEIQACDECWRIVGEAVYDDWCAALPEARAVMKARRACGDNTDPRRFTCDESPGEEVSWAEMSHANAEDEEVLVGIDALAVGETATFGGGAFASTHVTRTA